ncbi:MAG TPA: hypothetical protein VJB16_06085 [archaeon]|nr:hypothetical protein [archaeon]
MWPRDHLLLGHGARLSVFASQRLLSPCALQGLRLLALHRQLLVPLRLAMDGLKLPIPARLLLLQLALQRVLLGRRPALGPLFKTQLLPERAQLSR